MKRVHLKRQQGTLLIGRMKIFMMKKLVSMRWSAFLISAMDAEDV